MSKQRQKIIEIVFESCDFEEFAFLDQATNILTHEGRQTGLVVDIGETGAWAESVCEGRTLPSQCYNDFLVSGRSLNDLMADSLCEDSRNTYFERSARKNYVSRLLKDEYCGFVLNDQDLRDSNGEICEERHITLPDNTKVIF